MLSTKRTRVVGIVGLVVLAIVAPMGVVAEPATLESTDNGPTTAGATVTVYFEITNTGDNTSAYILNVESIPNSWNIEDRDDDGGFWKSSSSRWLFQTIDPGESRNPSLTFNVPAGASGDYTIDGEAYDNDGVVDTTSTTIAVVQATPTPEPTPTDDDDAEFGTPTPEPSTATAAPTATETATAVPTTTETPTATATPSPTETVGVTPTPTETPDEDDGIGTFSLVLLVLIIIAAAGGVAYYFLAEDASE
jgi:hypothetical protein